MMMKSIETQIIIYIALDLFVFIFAIFEGYVWVVNTQIAFLSAFSIVLLSFLSYLKNINKQIKTLGDIVNERDFIDEMDDPYELYENENDKKDKKSKIEISMKNLSKSKSAAFSLFRLIGYVILIAGFFLLLKMKSFQIIPYLAGISIIPLGGFINIVYQRKLNGN